MRARWAEAADGPEIVRLAGIMFATMGADLSNPAWEADGVAALTGRLGADLAVFVVDHPDTAGQLVACAAGTIAQRLPTPLNPRGLAGYVQWVSVDMAHRGQGLGRAVMTALLDWYREREVATVELHSTPAAEPLYTSLGFTDTGPRALRRRDWGR